MGNIIFKLLTIPGLALLSYGCISSKQGTGREKHEVVRLKEANDPVLRFKNLQQRFDTLIPVFHDLFITHQPIDGLNYLKLLTFCGSTDPDSIPTFNSLAYPPEMWRSFGTQRKWGIVDSSGHAIVPFVCDGIKISSYNEGIISIYAGSYSLNTGFPRYMYKGFYFKINKKGIVVSQRGKPFSKRVEGLADNHNEDFVIKMGHLFYLPIPDFRTKNGLTI